MLSLPALFGVMMVPCLAVLATSLIVSAFESDPSALSNKLSRKECP
ncbi:hypothetical protein ACFSJY_03690 [Thalassotalea euphylliae]